MSPLGAYTRLIDNADIVSFQVFDTVLVRRTANPDDVFHLVQHSGSRRVPYVGFDFVALRAEAAAKAQKKQAKDVCPATVDDIYNELELLAGLSPSAAQSIKELEFETERKVALANPAVTSLVLEARTAGKHVVFVADTSIPAEVTNGILEASGVPLPDHLAVSGEGLCLADGSLFQALMQSRGWPASRWVHVGSDLGSIEQARKLGIKCIQVASIGRDGWHRLEVERGWRRRFAGTEFLPDGVALDGIRTRQTEPHPGVWERVGFEVAGPVIVGFLQWMHQRAVSEQIEHLYFLARDGQIMRQMYAALFGDAALPNSYLFASRRLFNFAAIDDANAQDLEFLASNATGLTLAEVLSRVGLDASQYPAQLSRHGFADPRAVMSEQDDLRLCDLFHTLSTEVEHTAEKERALLLDYFDSVGLAGGQNAAVVDLGWQGTSHDSIMRICGFEREQLRGYYLFLIKDAAKKKLAGRNIEAMIDETVPTDLELFKDAGRACIPLVELLSTSASGTIIGLKRTPNGFDAIEKPLDLDAETRMGIESLQRGALRFANEWRSEGAPLLRRETVAAALARLIHDPQEDDAIALGSAHHHAGMAHASGGGYLARPEKGAFAYLFDHDSYRRELDRAFWKAGFRKRAWTGLPRALKGLAEHL